MHTGSAQAPSVDQDPLDYLLSLERLGMKFGLDNIRTLCAALDHPERSFRSVIVAGTNGKGSVTAMLATALHAAGHRSARYTSPHLERLEERFVVAEREVGTDELRAAARSVRDAIFRLLESRALEQPPTFFECATAIAFELFRSRSVEIAVLEVGLGGRLDATNVVNPIAAAITSIDFDHQAQLGDTLEAIAREKAGVVRPAIPVVCAPLSPEATRVIVEVCAGAGATLIHAAGVVSADARLEDGDTIAAFRLPGHVLSNVRLALRGRHQVGNAVTALALMHALDVRGVSIGEPAMIAGLTRTRWPARLERREWRGSTVLLDAAHNPAGAEALAAYLRDACWSDAALIVGVMGDKDAAGILTPLLPLVTAVVCTRPSTPRAMPPEALAALARRLPSAPARVDAIDEPAEALARAAGLSRRVVAAGSIFLVGPLRGILP